MAVVESRLDPSILREYDIRGIIGETLTSDVAELIGRCFGTMAAARGASAVGVGYDGRLSSPELEQALVAGLAACGLTVARFGRGPTPMLYFALHHCGIGAGVMVTGSHNPPDYNGFKLLIDRTPLSAEEIRALGRIAQEGACATGRGEVREVDVRGAYVERLAADYPRGRTLTVAWDLGNGATGDIIPQLCEYLPGARHVLVNEEVDGTFPAHHPDPAIPRNLTQLQDTVTQVGCDIGIAFDGDGDRIGIVDSGGEILWPDQVLLLLARDVLRERPGATIVADVKSSQTLFDGIEAAGGRWVMSPSGYPVIRRTMLERGAPLAGEMSGHLFFADRFYGADDALYCAVRVLAIAARAGEPLAAFRRALPKTVSTPELRIRCSEHRKREVVTEIAGRLRAAGADMLEIDGVRVRRGAGWWLLRASNTEPALAARCEARDAGTFQRLKDELAAELARSGVPVPDTLGRPGSTDGLGRGSEQCDEAFSGLIERP